MQQFYNWFASLAEEGRKEEEEKYWWVFFCSSYLLTSIHSLQVARVTNYQLCAHELLSEIKTTLRFLDDLETEYQVVSTKTGELHRACEALVQEKVRGDLPIFLLLISSRINWSPLWMHSVANSLTLMNLIE